MAAAYALVMPKSWQATQAMIVRGEAIGNDSEAAKSRNPEELKSTQETIVEVSEEPERAPRALAESGRRPIASQHPHGPATPMSNVCKRP